MINSHSVSRPPPRAVSVVLVSLAALPPLPPQRVVRKTFRQGHAAPTPPRPADHRKEHPFAVCFSNACCGL